MAEIESESKQGRRVVVIGGRVAGSLAAKLLQFHADVILIDPKEYFEITWASLRSMVEPSFAERTVINHKNYFKKGRVVTSPAVNITETDVMTADGDVIGYDYTILADCHFLCVGKPMSSQWLNGNSLKDSLDGKGRVMVDENLRIKDRKNVFAIGYIGEMHANMAVNNIKVMMSGGEKKKKMSTYKPGSEMAIVSLGRKYSVAQDSHWLPPWFDQVQGSIRGEDDEDKRASFKSLTHLKPPTQRPKTSARTAQRLIAHSMGLKLPASGFGSKELRDQEAARKNRIVSRQKQRDDAWGAD
ncbi:hypothetical protein HID58_038774 [Brassica napus]|uniref:FAD/NAD(P)-binding domain-containing protein n=1 Tax=Brassica napus TaxID=3708 RepID=A0ABQ8BQ78_BRANA|nr:hypothetical protein HID58_038774 [Brassica napus]